jgi:hypothetical protein
MIDLKNKTISLDLFFRFLKQIKNTDLSRDIIDSLSSEQFSSKTVLLNLLDQYNIINENSVVTVFGCWYGSILVPVLAPRVKHMVLIDINSEVIRFGKNRFFYDFENLTWVDRDAFGKLKKEVRRTTLFVNTSCEHMPPMKEWPHWVEITHDFYFAFQSNNMHAITGHVNTVNSIEEFKNQLPKNFQIIAENVYEEYRGKRYTLIGKKTEKNNDA